MTQVKNLAKGDYIRSYHLCGDEEWHRVFEVEDKGGGKVYLAIEKVGGRIVLGNTEVERMYR